MDDADLTSPAEHSQNGKFLGSLFKKKQEFLLAIGEILKEFPVLHACVREIGERVKRRENSHFVSHVKDQRSDRDEKQAHPEDSRAEHHFCLQETHTTIKSKVTVDNRVQQKHLINLSNNPFPLEPQTNTEMESIGWDNVLKVG